MVKKYFWKIIENKDNKYFGKKSQNRSKFPKNFETLVNKYFVTPLQSEVRPDMSKAQDRSYNRMPRKALKF